MKRCPFCNGEVIEHQDDCGGSWIDHKEGHKNGSMQKCILTDTHIYTSSRTHFGWDDAPRRTSEPRLMEECPEQLIVDTMVKEQHRNNPDRPDKHKYSSYCSCGHCLMAHLITEAMSTGKKPSVREE